MQGISEAAFSLANFLGPIGGSHVAAQGSVGPGTRQKIEAKFSSE